MGEPGTEVELTVEPAAAASPVTSRSSGRRSGCPRSRARSGGWAGTKVAYVRFYGFSRGAHGELRSEIERLYREGAEGLVLDLRGNGGGLLNEAVLSASVFVEEGDVVTTRSRARGEQIYDATGGALDPRPTVVLINRDTASAAEILASAISSYDLGTIVGEPSFGKGTFQEVIHLPDGGALDLTIGEYLTADGGLAGRQGDQARRPRRRRPARRPATRRSTRRFARSSPSCLEPPRIRAPTGSRPRARAAAPGWSAWSRDAAASRWSSRCSSAAGSCRSRGAS